MELPDFLLRFAICLFGVHMYEKYWVHDESWDWPKKLYVAMGGVFTAAVLSHL